MITVNYTTHTSIILNIVYSIQHLIYNMYIYGILKLSLEYPYVHQDYVINIQYNVWNMFFYALAYNLALSSVLRCSGGQSRYDLILLFDCKYTCCLAEDCHRRARPAKSCQSKGEGNQLALLASRLAHENPSFRPPQNAKRCARSLQVKLG